VDWKKQTPAIWGCLMDIHKTHNGYGLSLSSFSNVCFLDN